MEATPESRLDDLEFAVRNLLTQKRDVIIYRDNGVWIAEYREFASQGNSPIEALESLNRVIVAQEILNLSNREDL